MGREPAHEHSQACDRQSEPRPKDSGLPDAAHRNGPLSKRIKRAPSSQAGGRAGSRGTLRLLLCGDLAQHLPGLPKSRSGPHHAGHFPVSAGCHGLCVGLHPGRLWGRVCSVARAHFLGVNTSSITSFELLA